MSLPAMTENVETTPEVPAESEPSPLERPQPARKTKSRVILNFWLDAMLLVTVVFIGWVSALLHIVFPAPTMADGWVLWGMTFDQWHNIQSTALCVCGLLAVEHVVLHWNWVCSTIATKIFRVKVRPDEGIQALYGVGTFIVVMLIVFSGVIVAMLCVQQPGV